MLFRVQGAAPYAPVEPALIRIWPFPAGYSRSECFCGRVSTFLSRLKSLETLLVLVEHGGRIVEKEELHRQIWPDTVVEDVSLAKNVSTLRKTLGESESHRYIETVPRRGYRFVAEVRVLESGECPVPDQNPTRTRGFCPGLNRGKWGGRRANEDSFPGGSPVVAVGARGSGDRRLGLLAGGSGSSLPPAFAFSQDGAAHQFPGPPGPGGILAGWEPDCFCLGWPPA